MPRSLLPLLCTMLALVIGPGAMAAQPTGFKALEIGAQAPDFRLLGIDEEFHTLGQYQAKPWLVIAFISNHCPTSQAAVPRLRQLAADYAPQGLQVLAVNPNDAAALRPEELGYSALNDSFPEMKHYAKQAALPFPYLYDGETQAMAKAYGCEATPQIFIFDAKRQLRYRGRLDDSRHADAKTVTRHDARLALDALLAGKPAAQPITSPHGCTTKWIEKRVDVAAAQKAWQQTPIEVELIEAAGAAKLRENHSQKYRLINLWATWCGPCVEEFPQLVATARRFALREFELVTISVNEPSEMAEVKEFLQKQQAAVPKRLLPSLKAEGRRGNAYVFDSKGAPNGDALFAAMGPGTEASVPQTFLIAPGGKVLYHCNGEIHGEELRAKILGILGTQLEGPAQPPSAKTKGSK